MFIQASGEPGTGKSVWASLAAPIIAGRIRSGVIVCDMVGSRVYSKWRVVPDVRSAIYLAQVQKQHVVLRRPTLSMVDSLCMYLITQGDKTPTEQIPPCVLVIDEIRWVATVRKTKSENLLLLARGHRNVNVVLIGTTQSYGDLSRDLTCSVTQHRIYRCSAGQDIRRLKADINPEVAARVKNLWKPPENSGAKEGEFVTYP